MTPDQASSAILRGDYSLEAADVWISWRQQHNAPLVLDRLCAWLVSRVKDLEAPCDLVPRGTSADDELTPGLQRSDAAHFLAALTDLERNAERWIQQSGLHDYTLRTEAARKLRHGIHLVFNDGLTLLDRFTL